MGQFNYATNDGAITITYCNCAGGTVDIPSNVGGLPVVEIGPGAFQCLEPVGVTIPSSVTNISLGAFHYCFGLTNLTVDSANPAYASVGGALLDKPLATLLQYPRGRSWNENFVIPNGVVRIADYAFSGSAGLGGVSIPSSIVEIGAEAFSYCTGLQDLILPAGVTNLGISAFAFCSGLINARLPNTLERISSRAFQQCTSLASMVIPDSVTVIEGEAISECGSLTAVALGIGVKDIQLLAFFGAASLTNIIIPPGVTNIDDSAFRDCLSLTTVTIPDSVLRIASGAFSKCYSLTNFTIGSGLVDLGWDVFLFSEKLANIEVSVSNTAFASRDGILFNKDFTTLVQCPGGITGSYRISSSVASIGRGAFFYCTGLTNVTIPRSVNFLGRQAFSYCINVNGFFFEGSPPGFDRYVFEGADSAMIYYMADVAETWGTPYADRPTQLWDARIETSDLDFGVRSNQFGFNVKGTQDTPITVAAATNLNSPAWVLLQSLKLTNGVAYFRDTNWANSSARFYRINPP